MHVCLCPLNGGEKPSALVFDLMRGQPRVFNQCRWINEPARWNLGPDRLFVTTDNATDFWRETHYGFTRHSGHLFGHPVSGGFTASVRVNARYQSLYDQAGLMVLADEKNWVKAGIELSDGDAMLSSVVTIGRSDWATGHFQGEPSDFWIRLTLDRGVLRIQASADGLRWPLVRLCPFPMRDKFVLGPMCCTPERAGLEVEFSAFEVSPALDKNLHDLS
jgi:uncharacterized protein